MPSLAAAETVALLPSCLEVLTRQRVLALPARLRRRNEVRALTFALMRDHGALDRLAPEERETHRRAYLSALAWNLIRLERLDQVLEACGAAGLRVVPIKGGALCQSHYGDPGARPMVDLDLLCALSDLDKVAAILRGLGFQPLAASPTRVALGGVHDVKFVDGPVMIELHFRLWHELDIDSSPDGLLARAVETQLGQHRALVPSTADHLYLVLVHAALHGFAGNALWLSDAALLAADGGEAVWPEVNELGRAAGASLAVATATDHLALVFPGCVPEAARSSAAPLRRRLLRYLAPWLERGEAELGTLASRLVRPLLFERPGPLLGWARNKLRLWLRGAT